MEQLSDVGLIGLGVMGENLALNMERNGRRVRCGTGLCPAWKKVLRNVLWKECCRKANSGLFGLVRVCGIFEPTENYYDDGAGR